MSNCALYSIVEVQLKPESKRLVVYEPAGADIYHCYTQEHKTQPGQAKSNKFLQVDYS